MSLRHLTRDDASDALDVWNRAATFDPIALPLLDEKIWQDPDYDRDLAWAFEISGQLVGFAVGVLRAASDPPISYVKLVAVDPGYHRKQIGTRLLECVESKLTGRGVEQIRIAESAPNYLTPGVDQRYAAARSFFEHHGYEHFANSVNLRVDLETSTFETGRAEQQLAAQGIAIRRATATDWRDVETFLDPLWPSWKTETLRALANSPVSLFLATQGNAVIGFAAYHGNNVGTGWFGPMGTAPDRRKSGIGAALLRCCLSDLRQQGFTSSTIAWAAHWDFYKRHVGATVDREFCRYRKMTCH